MDAGKFKGKAWKAQGVSEESEAFDSMAPALAFCNQKLSEGFKGAVLLRADTSGINERKFFLHHIVK